MHRRTTQQLKRRESVVARPRSLVDAVTGGQCLPSLLVHYYHHEFKFNGKPELFDVVYTY